MGRFPFLKKVSEYTERIKAYYAPRTCIDNTQKLRMIGRQFEQMREAGRIKTSDPRYIREQEIEQFLLLMRERGLQEDTMAEYLRVLKRFLRFCNNAIIDRIKMEHLLPLPRASERKEIRTLDEVNMNRIFATCDTLHSWQGEVARFIFAFFAYTGVRHAELRLAHRQDLDTTAWTFKVRNPKCKTRGAPERTVLIPAPLRPIVQEFLIARAEWLRDYGFNDAIPLIPSPPTKKSDNKPDFCSYSTFENIKLEVEQLSGVNFRIKDFRSTFAQISKDRGVSIEAVSKALGHASTVTTERFYARIRDTDALKEMEIVWSQPIGTPREKLPRNIAGGL